MEQIQWCCIMPLIWGVNPDLSGIVLLNLLSQLNCFYSLRSALVWRVTFMINSWRYTDVAYCMSRHLWWWLSCWVLSDSWNPRTSLVAQMVKHLPTVRETQVQSLGWEYLLEKEMATHSSILAWKISWTEKPGGSQSMGSQRVGHDWATSLLLSWTEAFCPWGFLGKNTGVGCHFILQEIFLIQGSNPDLLHYSQILYRLRYQGRCFIQETFTVK